MGIKELKEDIANFMSDLDYRELPYGVTEKLEMLMDKHKIKRVERGNGFSF